MNITVHTKIHIGHLKIKLKHVTLEKLYIQNPSNTYYIIFNDQQIILIPHCAGKAFSSVDILPSFCASTSGLDTPVELKLKLIPMLQHMHHDASLASSSRELLQHLVNSYPSTPMVIVTLHTFTQLAASSLVDIPKQVGLRLRLQSRKKCIFTSPVFV